MSMRIIGLIVAAIGLIVLLVAATADVTGLADSASDGWGNRQTLAAVGGIVLIIGGGVGFILGQRKR